MQCRLSESFSVSLSLSLSSLSLLGHRHRRFRPSSFSSRVLFRCCFLPSFFSSRRLISSSRLVSFHFISFCFISFRFVSFRFVSSFRFIHSFVHSFGWLLCRGMAVFGHHTHWGVGHPLYCHKQFVSGAAVGTRLIFPHLLPQLAILGR